MPAYEKLPADVCGNCRHFRLHYIRRYRGCYAPLSYGHCVFPRSKPRNIHQTCPHWAEKEQT